MGQFSFKRRLKFLIVSIRKIFRSAASLLLKAEAANLWHGMPHHCSWRCCERISCCCYWLEQAVIQDIIVLWPSYKCWGSLGLCRCSIWNSKLDTGCICHTTKSTGRGMGPNRVVLPATQSSTLNLSAEAVEIYRWNCMARQWALEHTPQLSLSSPIQPGCSIVTADGLWSNCRILDGLMTILVWHQVKHQPKELSAKLFIFSSMTEDVTREQTVKKISQLKRFQILHILVSFARCGYVNLLTTHIV